MAPKLPWLAAIILLTLAPLAAEAQAVGGPSWQPDPSLTAHLGDYVRLDRCSLRLPQGYSVHPVTGGDDGVVEYVVIGPREPSGEYPTMRVFNETSSSDAGSAWTPLPDLRAREGAEAGTIAARVTTPIAVGTVGGRPAWRFYDKGEAVLDGQAVERRLFAYAVGDSSGCTIAVALDSSAASSRNLAILEAALLTLRQTAAPPALAPSGLWRPRLDLLRYLVPETSVGDLRIRPPASFYRSDITAPTPAPYEINFAFGWEQHGVVKAQPTALRFTIVGEAERDHVDLAEIMSRLATREGVGLINYLHTPVEYGWTGYGWTGRFTASGDLRVGARDLGMKQIVVYGFLTASQFVQVEGFDLDGDLKTLRIIEAAILSGRIPGAPHPTTGPADASNIPVAPALKATPAMGAVPRTAYQGVSSAPVQGAGRLPPSYRGQSYPSTSNPEAGSQPQPPDPGIAYGPVPYNREPAPDQGTPPNPADPGNGGPIIIGGQPAPGSVQTPDQGPIIFGGAPDQNQGAPP